MTNRASVHISGAVEPIPDISRDSNLRQLPDHDRNFHCDPRDIASQQDHYLVSPLSVSKRTIEAFTDGDDRRAYARAAVHEITPDVFTVTPFFLQEISGPHVYWTKPAKHEAIATTQPISTLNEAIEVLAGWASWTFAHNAAQHR